MMSREARNNQVEMNAFIALNVIFLMKYTKLWNIIYNFLQKTT